MRRSSHPLAFGLLLIAGCGAPGKSTVYVDLNAVDRSQALSPAAQVVDPQPPKGTGRAGFVQPGLPSRVLHDQTRQRMEEARKLIEQNRVEAYRDLSQRLRSAYQDEVDRFQEHQRQQLLPKEQAALMSLRQRLRALFEKYADQRSPLVARLALLAGFPDLDPNSQRQVANPTNTFAKKRLAEAKTLREALDKLDGQYDGDARLLIQNSQAGTESELKKLQADVAQMRSDANRRADQEAARQVSANQKELGLTLATKDEITLPQVPAHAAPAVNAPIPAPAPAVRPTRLLADPTQRRKLLEADLQIWLAINGYHRSENRSGVKDATDEFKKWEQSHQPGR